MKNKVIVLFLLGIFCMNKSSLVCSSKNNAAPAAQSSGQLLPLFGSSQTNIANLETILDKIRYIVPIGEELLNNIITSTYINATVQGFKDAEGKLPISKSDEDRTLQAESLLVSCVNKALEQNKAPSLPMQQYLDSIDYVLIESETDIKTIVRDAYIKGRKFIEREKRK